MKNNFLFRILEGNKFDFGYTCQCDSDFREIEDNPTNNNYFFIKTNFQNSKISGSMVTSFDKELIFIELLQDIELR